MALAQNIYIGEATHGDRHIDAAISFAKQALNNKAKNCKFIRKLSSEFLTRISQGIPGYFLSDVAVSRICTLIESLPHVKGSQFTGTIELAPWQSFHFVNAFGWLDSVDETRKHQIIFTQVSKKNGKSTMAAPVGIYLMSPLEGEKGAEIYCAASKKSQADIVLKIARQMLRSAPRVCDELNISVWAHHIECDYRGTTGTMSSVASDSPQTDDGINPSGILMDEVHAMSDGELRGTLLKGIVARENGLAYEISTAGELRENSPCFEENEKAKKWIKGDIDLPAFYGMIFEQDDPALEITKPKTWYKSNPNLGVTFDKGALKVILDDAKDSPMLKNQFTQKHLNCFTGSTESWINMDVWHKCIAREEDKPEGLPLFLGFDLSSVIDLSAIGLVWVDESVHPVQYWIKADSFATKLGCERNNLVELFAQKGEIEIIGDKKIDQSAIEARIHDIGEREDVLEIGFDSWNASHLAERLEDKFEMIEVRQGARTFSEPMKNFEAALRAGNVKIIGGKCLAWQAANLVAKKDGNDNWAPVKQANKNKVDALVAILIAFVRAWKHTKEDQFVTADEILGA